MKNKSTNINSLRSFVQSVSNFNGSEEAVTHITTLGITGGDNNRCINEESEACKDTVNTRCVNRGNSDLTCIYAYNERCIMTD